MNVVGLLIFSFCQANCVSYNLKDSSSILSDHEVLIVWGSTLVQQTCICGITIIPGRVIGNNGNRIWERKGEMENGNGQIVI